MNRCHKIKQIDRLTNYIFALNVLERSLSFGRRLTLIKSVLSHLPSYYFSLFVAPGATLNELERIRLRFLWGGSKDLRKIYWVSQDKILAPKEKGGLDVGSLKAYNIALCCKWWWRLKKEPNSLWAKVIRDIHRLDNKPDDFLASRSRSRVWCSIAKVKLDLIKHNIPFNSVIRRGAYLREASWVSDLANGGRYMVSSLRQTIDNSISITPLGPFLWTKVVPLKVSCFAWRVKLDWILSAVNIHRRGINSVDKNCSYCGAMEETTNHLLCGCPAVRSILDRVFTWCGIQLSRFSQVAEVLNFASSWGNCSQRRRTLTNIFTVCFGAHEELVMIGCSTT